MSGDGLFHIDPSGELVAMTVTPYEAEDILQKLLESHPDLLAGGQMTPEDPRRWKLVKREHGVPDRDDAGSRWSVDHLFVDQDAVPTLVEVKRSSDTRIRREVVGQMLDYAANGVRYWPINDVRSAFEQTQRDHGVEPLEAIRDLSRDPSADIDEFFARVADNLRAGRIRMVFVADVIPDELMRITEFLNEQMDPAQVFAVEVKQYASEGHPGLVIVPAVYGRTSAASVKGRPGRGKVNREELLSKSLPETHEVLTRVATLSAAIDGVLWETPAGALLKTPSGRSVANVYLADWNTLEIPLQPLRDRGHVAEADGALERLQALTSKRLTPNSPNVPTPDVVAAWTEVEAILRDLHRLASDRI